MWYLNVRGHHKARDNCRNVQGQETDTIVDRDPPSASHLRLGAYVPIGIIQHTSPCVVPLHSTPQELCVALLPSSRRCSSSITTLSVIHTSINGYNAAYRRYPVPMTLLQARRYLQLLPQSVLIWMRLQLELPVSLAAPMVESDGTDTSEKILTDSAESR